MESSKFSNLPVATCKEMLHSLGVSITPYTPFSPSAEACGCVIIDYTKKLNDDDDAYDKLMNDLDDVIALTKEISQWHEFPIFWILNLVREDKSALFFTSAYSLELRRLFEININELNNLLYKTNENNLVARFKNSKMEPLSLFILDSEEIKPAMPRIKTIIDINVNTGEVGEFCSTYNKAAHWVFCALSGECYTSTTLGKSVKETPLGLGTSKAERVALKTAEVGFTGLKWLMWPIALFVLVMLQAAIMSS